MLSEEPGLLSDPESPLSDAEEAIGQVIEHAESWAVAQHYLDPAEVSRVLLEICGPWTGEKRSDEKDEKP